MNNKLPTELSISPHNNLSKYSVCCIGLIIFSIFVIFSYVWIAIGAWPITVFMGLEYIGLTTLIIWFYKKRKIKEYIKIDDNQITYKLFHEKKIKKTCKFKYLLD